MVVGAVADRRFIALPLIALLHFLGFHILTNSLRIPATLRSPDERLMTVFIQPQIRDTPIAKEPDLSRLTFLTKDNVQAIHTDMPSLDFEVERNVGSAISAPNLKADTGADMAPYIRQAALFPGQGATIVLRIEVLDTGEPGGIEVDASSGSRRIDQAAVNYVRTLRWYPGRANGKPRSMWIRWGVRLQA